MKKPYCQELRRETGGAVVMMQRSRKSLNLGICSKVGKAYRRWDI